MPTIKRDFPPGFESFDRLPDSAQVPVSTYALIEGVSEMTAWRRIKEGVIAVNRCGRSTRIEVGAIRAARQLQRQGAAARAAA